MPAAALSVAEVITLHRRHPGESMPNANILPVWCSPAR